MLQATYYMVANPVAACSEVENTSEKGNVADNYLYYHWSCLINEELINFQ